MKSVIDFTFSLFALIILMPIIIVVTILLFITNDGKPFFTQDRAGFRGRVFTLIKFRTMNDRRDSDNNLLPDYERLTWIGNIVRKTSLDELPQLINVLKGDMSLIGPRPFLAEYLSIYTEEEMGRFKVKPGITGWAQINGRNAISWKKKFKLDLWYVQNISFLLDVKIVFLTILKVFNAKDVSGTDQVTAEKYNGSN